MAKLKVVEDGQAPPAVRVTNVKRVPVRLTVKRITKHEFEVERGHIRALVRRCLPGSLWQWTILGVGGFMTSRTNTAPSFRSAVVNAMRISTYGPDNVVLSGRFDVYRVQVNTVFYTVVHFGEGWLEVYYEQCFGPDQDEQARVRAIRLALEKRLSNTDG